MFSDKLIWDVFFYKRFLSLRDVECHHIVDTILCHDIVDIAFRKSNIATNV